MLKPLFLITFCLFCFCNHSNAQTGEIPTASFTTEQNRTKEFRNLVSNSINKNLSLPLTDSTEENWQAAFYALELLQFKPAWVEGKIRQGFDSIGKRSLPFQRAFLELTYTNYHSEFIPQVAGLLKQTNNPKLFAMCVEYLTMNNRAAEFKNLILKRIDERSFDSGITKTEPFLSIIKNKLSDKASVMPPLSDLLNKSLLPGEIVMFSFQRKNRDYPGLVLVRSKDGSFVKDETGNYFSVPQLARSITNMPGYLTNGNTPQGIFKMTGFAVSRSNFIGPTTNVQMLMPFETSTDIPDSISKSLAENYSLLLPVSWKNYGPVYGSYFAGLAGRTEIIAHGTTVNPAYYNKQPYYPLTPTQGCLCTKELWSTTDGKRMESDQQKLVNALTAAGGATGYCLVIEIDDLQKPVSIEEILPYLKL